MDYKALYYGLFNAITRADAALEHNRPLCARLILKRAQIDAENRLLEQAPSPEKCPSENPK